LLLRMRAARRCRRRSRRCCARWSVRQLSLRRPESAGPRAPTPSAHRRRPRRCNARSPSRSSLPVAGAWAGAAGPARRHCRFRGSRLDRRRPSAKLRGQTAVGIRNGRSQRYEFLRGVRQFAVVVQFADADDPRGDVDGRRRRRVHVRHGLGHPDGPGRGRCSCGGLVLPAHFGARGFGGLRNDRGGSKNRRGAHAILAVRRFGRFALPFSGKWLGRRGHRNRGLRGIVRSVRRRCLG